MVRPRIVFRSLESELMKIHHFSHQKTMVTERIRDLSVLTGADILYLAFSPSDGPPFICLGQNTEFSEIIRRFGEQPFYEREKRRMKNFGTLRTCLAKRGLEVNVQVLSNAWKRKRMDDLNEELRRQKAKLSEIDYKICLLANPKNINNVEKIEEMAQPLRESIDGLRKRKAHLDKLGEETQNEEANAQESQNEEAAADKVPLQVPQAPHNGTNSQGISENLNQLMLQGNVESSKLPTMNTQNVESGPELKLKDPIQHSNHDLGSYNNFGFRPDLSSDGLDFDFMHELENIGTYSFYSLLQSEEAGPSTGDISSSPYFRGF
ncbi:Transcription factor [Macleaya cordata]|uniref:Transcription factor n=1 Tax=Macleaya cordata TaxID=56857 RepID=A0A200QQZ7_MACCD|nr:Transcription factor [Macleaya cordata]